MLSDWGYGAQDFGSFPDDDAPIPSKCERCGTPLTLDNTSLDVVRPTLCEPCEYYGCCTICGDELLEGEEGWCANCSRAEHAD